MRQIGAVEQRSGQRRSQLVRQRSSHFAHRGQPLVAFDIRFQFMGHRYVVDQQDAPTRRVERAFGDRHPAIGQLPFIGRVGRNQLRFSERRPVFAADRLAKHVARNRVGLADPRRAVEHDNASRQGVEQQGKSFGQRLLLLILPAQLTIGDGQLDRQRLNFGLKPFVSLGEFERNLVENIESPL